jgi:prepilin-type N-terminal cleavage/methylation domain-containing protein
LRDGFTITEITVTLCVLSVLSAIAVPWAGKLLDRVHVRGATIEVESVFSAARHIAIARSAHTAVDIDTTSRTMYVSVAGETVRKREIGTDHGVTLSSSREQMTYAATGIGYGAANLSVVVRRGGAVDTVFVSRLGRVRH